MKAKKNPNCIYFEGSWRRAVCIHTFRGIYSSHSLAEWKWKTFTVLWKLNIRPGCFVSLTPIAVSGNCTSFSSFPCCFVQCRLRIRSSFYMDCSENAYFLNKLGNFSFFCISTLPGTNTERINWQERPGGRHDKIKVKTSIYIFCTDDK